MNSFNPKTEAQKIESYKNFKKNFPGTLMTFVYKPKMKLFYDSIPLILGIRLVGSKLFGVNLRLMPPRERVKLFNGLLAMRYEKEPNRIIISKLLRSKYSRGLAACFGVYSIRDVKSKIKVLSEKDWDLFLFNDHNSFKNRSKGLIYNSIKEKIKTIKMPIKYMLQIIKNNINKKNGQKR